MDLAKVGEKLLSSVLSARSLNLLPSSSDRPEVPARAAAAAAVAKALAGLPPHQRFSLPSNSEELVSIYGIKPRGQVIEELEEDFYDEEFDPVRCVLEHIPSDENDLFDFEKKATLRLAQLDNIAERLSCHVMEHHEEMVKGMQLVMELEQDLKVANVICMNGRRHLSSSMHEVSRDLIVTSSAKKKQVLLDMLPILAELRHATDMRKALSKHVDDGNYFRAFQVLSEYLQVLDSLSELSAIQEMSRGVEDWLGTTLHKLDSLLLGVCQDFKEESYITVVDAYALIGDIAGLAEKIQSFFMQEVLSETHFALKDIMQEALDLTDTQKRRLTYSDLCLQIPESKFRQCLLKTLDALFKLICSYYLIMSFQLHERVPESQTSNGKSRQNGTSEHLEGNTLVDSISNNRAAAEFVSSSADSVPTDVTANMGDEYSTQTNSSVSLVSGIHSSVCPDGSVYVASNETPVTSSSSSWDHLRKDAIVFVAQRLQRGRKNLWQLTSSRVSVLLSCPAVCSASTHQFLRNYEDLNVFILAGEAFCGSKAVELRQKLKTVCENYLAAFHRQNIYALKMVLEKDTWLQISPDTIQVISLAGLLGDGAPLIVPSDGNHSKASICHSPRLSDSVQTGNLKDGFAHWLRMGNPFTSKLAFCHKDCPSSPTTFGLPDTKFVHDNGNISSGKNNGGRVNWDNSILEDESEDLHADFIDEDSQLPSRMSKPIIVRNHPAHWNDDEIRAQTGSSLSLLRLMDKYARLMQKLEVVNVEFFKGICQLFEVFFHFVFETFGQRELYINGKGATDSSTHRLRTALTRITQDLSDDCIKPQTVQSSLNPPGPQNTSFLQTEVTPISPAGTHFGHAPSISVGLKERSIGAETISLVARILHRSRGHLQSMLLQNNAAMVEDFYTNLVDSVPDLTQHIHRTTARLLLNINGYVDRVANAKWELKDLGLEHNGYVDLLLGEFKHYKTRLAHGGIQKEVQDILLEYGLENVAETLIEGLSRVKRCTNEGRALMSLDLQVLINGLQHFVSINVKPKLQTVETFIKAYYLPETEYVYWARSHPEYSRSQMTGLINLVAAMKGWKRKTRLEVLEKIETSTTM